MGNAQSEDDGLQLNSALQREEVMLRFVGFFFTGFVHQKKWITLLPLKHRISDTCFIICMLALFKEGSDISPSRYYTIESFGPELKRINISKVDLPCVLDVLADNDWPDSECDPESPHSPPPERWIEGEMMRNPALFGTSGTHSDACQKQPAVLRAD